MIVQINGKPEAHVAVVNGKAHLPTTRYYGSKRRQINWLTNQLLKYEFHSVLDAFGGTGTVSLHLSNLGKEVFYHDSFHFNSISARALLSPNSRLIRRERLEGVISAVRPQSGFITKNYDGIFYPKSENRWLDGALRALDEARLRRGDQDVFQYCLFQACLQKRPYNMFHRANLGMRTARNVSRSFGNLTTWETPFEVLMLRAYDELVLARGHYSGRGKVIKPTSVMSIKPEFDLVYLDPPYLRERAPETYLRRYHFLEGVARRTNWADLIDRESGCNFFRKDYFSEDWENPKTIEIMLDRLIEIHSGATVALSYVDNGVPDVGALRRIFKRHFSETKIYRMPVSYALSRRSNGELLIIGRNQ
ncbi:DNA adenine methylase [Stenotrophomonas maltophilia]|uniref:DNA adenine methylase n=1 Tax=Stenotrophomonas TaxID=40323 RepID=UPI00130435D5|nr:MULTISPECIES: DNA adenine methylase [Stenotrophomonas]EKU9981128.1 DNA adenine methylase [Stenotrophomonas maltophilia]EKX6273344.1 DNA adenine methylase [Stenotrophomonas maltophilia]MBH1721515.1 DNA adenine methylase [Stenotrophomonas maltophilia]MBH1796883.1 DNA adenine methylase [Stenotrophomonas maltophilia]MBH1889539.1 DNA adenine methylase [Stenotrophomonas maltophilia]